MDAGDSIIPFDGVATDFIRYDKVERQEAKLIGRVWQNTALEFSSQRVRVAVYGGCVYWWHGVNSY